MRALGRGDEQIEAPIQHRAARIHGREVFAEVADAWVIQRVGRDRELPVVDREQVDLEAEKGAGREQSARGAAGAAEEIDGLENARHGAFLRAA